MSRFRELVDHLWHRRRQIVVGATALLGAGAFLLGLFKHEPIPIVGGLVGTAYGMWRLRALQEAAHRAEARCAAHMVQVTAAAPQAKKVAPTDAAGLVDDLMSQGRHALLLRPQVVANLATEQVHAAWAGLTEVMTLVPEGEVWIGDGQVAGSDSRNGDYEEGQVHRVEAFLLDRFAVTNAQYQAFVDAGGYELMSLWDPQIWPGVLDFVDRTGYPGPRLWREGRFAAGEGNVPVVGICWYEASAFARWVGKRLPSDAEWEKAASWPAQLAASPRPGRRYPWGDVLEQQRCNLYGVLGRPAQVDEFAAGASVGGAHQMSGNVWEWTSGAFGTAGGEFLLTAPLRNIRGGAFDTYFGTQATCQFRSGEDPLARKHNIGFRCVVSTSELTFGGGGQSAADDEDVARDDEPQNDPTVEALA